MTRSVDDLAADVRRALDALHRLSVGAGDARLYANEAALHRIYSDVDEATAELVALVGTLTQQRDEARHEADYQCRQVTSILVRALAAEAALADMRRALRNVIPIADSHLHLSHKDERLIEQARRALAAAPAPEPHEAPLGSDDMYPESAT